MLLAQRKLETNKKIYKEESKNVKGIVKISQHRTVEHHKNLTRKLEKTTEESLTYTKN